MGDSLARRHREMQKKIGPHGNVKEVYVGRKGGLVYKVTCLVGGECAPGPGMLWNTYQQARRNDYRATLERWTSHIEWHMHRGDVESTGLDTPE